MALLAEQIPRWFNSIKLSNFIKAVQITKHSTRPGKTLSNGFSSQALLSSDNCFLLWGIKTYKTSSFWNSFQSANSNRQENNSSEQNTLLPSVSEKPERMPSLESELFLEELDDLPSLSPIQPISEEEAIQIVAHPLLPLSSFTLGDYIDHSETLQQLVQLGVDLSKIERHIDVANFLLRLDFEKDIKQILLFLKDLGLEDNHLGPFLTKNYTIFSEDLENLKTRVAYLQSKHFSKTDIVRMVRNAPFLLSFSVERLDNRLGFFQKELELSVKKTRDLVVHLPRLLTGSLEPVKENMKVYRLELGFKHNEIQHMVTRVPKMLTTNKRKLTETFDYVHNVMNIPHHIIVKFPQVCLTPAREPRVSSRTYPEGSASVSPVIMAGRPAVAASSKWLDGFRKWYYNAAGFNKLGLMRDDTLHETEDVKEAIRRLPEHLYNDRMFRIKRALDLSMRHQILPKEQWTKYEEDKFYLKPYLKEVIRERKEKEEWAKK